MQLTTDDEPLTCLDNLQPTKKVSNLYRGVFGSESDPCVAFSPTEPPNAFRIVPSSAFAGSVAPIRSRQALTAPSFSSTNTTHGALDMNSVNADAVARSRTGDHHPRLELPLASRTHARRDPSRLSALARRHAQRADAIIVPSAFTAGEVERIARRPRIGLRSVRPERPTGRRARRRRARATCCFSARWSRGKTSAALLDAYEQLLTRPDFDPVPELVLAGKATEEAQPWLDRIARPPLAGHVRHVGYVDPQTTPRVVRRRTAAGAAVVRRGLRHAGAGGDDARRAGRRGQSRIAAGSARRRRCARRSRSAGRHRAGDRAVLHDDVSLAPATDRRGSRRARAFRWSDESGRSRLRTRDRRTADRAAGPAAPAAGACASALTRASCAAGRPASAAIWPACSANGRGRGTRRGATNSCCTRGGRSRLPLDARRFRRARLPAPAGHGGSRSGAARDLRGSPGCLVRVRRIRRRFG